MPPHGRYPIFGRELHDHLPVGESQNTRSTEKSVNTLPSQPDKGVFEIARFSHLNGNESKPSAGAAA